MEIDKVKVRVCWIMEVYSLEITKTIWWMKEPCMSYNMILLIHCLKSSMIMKTMWRIVSVGQVIKSPFLKISSPKDTKILSYDFFLILNVKKFYSKVFLHNNLCSSFNIWYKIQIIFDLLLKNFISILNRCRVIKLFYLSNIISSPSSSLIILCQSMLFI